LEELGARHAGYGTSTEHYPVVRRALLDMFAEVMGPAFTTESRAAWDELYDFIEAAMLRGAATAPPPDSMSPTGHHGGNDRTSGKRRPQSRPNSSTSTP
jgi:nitric oxide dioxygenase